jgi:hypothetical protein
LDERVAGRTSVSRPVAAALACAVLLAGAAAGVVLVRPSPATGRPAASRAWTESTIWARPHATSGEAGLAAFVAGVPRATGSIPADCMPAPSGPPGSAYQLGVTGTISNGLLSAGSASVFDVSAKFCGVVTVVAGKPPCAATGTVTAPKDGQVFGSMSATLTLVPAMAPEVPFVAHPGTITGGFACESSVDGLAVNLTADVSASTGLYGLSCTIGPLSIPLSGVVTGPLTDASVTLRGSDFAVPAVSSSSTCSGEVPSDLDAIAGLPIAAGGATVVLPAKVSLYRPGT